MDDMEIARQCVEALWVNDPASRGMGMQVEVARPGCAETRFQVRQDMVNGHDICHGGYIFALADSAFAFACNTYDRITVAAGASIEFLRPAHLGDTLTAVATETHRGGRTGIYDIAVSNQRGELVAIFRGRSHATREPILKSDTEKIE